MQVSELPTGVMIKAADSPIVGDVNRNATDALPLHTLSTLTKPLRLQVANLGPDDPDFAARWLGRFDNNIWLQD